MGQARAAGRRSAWVTLSRGWKSSLRLDMAARREAAEEECKCTPRREPLLEPVLPLPLLGMGAWAATLLTDRRDVVPSGA